MTKGLWLEILRQADELWPLLIEESLDRWTTLDIDYDTPRVERLWRTMEYRMVGDSISSVSPPMAYRLYLHRIHPCDKGLWHPHPWPSAVKVLSGRYEMGVGEGISKHDPPPSATLVLTPGSEYEMVHPDGWHYVRPLGPEPSLSIMVSGAPWHIKHLGEKKPTGTLRPLSPEAADDMITAFNRVHWSRNAPRAAEWRADLATKRASRRR